LLIRIVRQEAKSVKEEKKQTKQEASTPPKGGDRWKHLDGQSLEEAQVGQLVKGKVTNVLQNRVWVNAGFVTDVTFLAASGHRYDSGMELEGLMVVDINQEQSRINVKPTRATSVARKSAARVRAASRSEKPRPQKSGEPQADAAGALTAPSETVAETEEVALGGRQAGTDGAAPSISRRKSKAALSKLDAAATRRPEHGWSHEGGRELAELRVGEVVDGRVTNIYRRRVWVDIGASRDASFSIKGAAVKVGDVLQELTITEIDWEKGFIEVKQPTVESAVMGES